MVAILDPRLSGLSTRRASTRLRRRPRPGLTLVEIVASTFLVGALLVGALAAVAGIFRTWSAVETRHDALALAHWLMAEIVQQRYEEPDDEPRFGLEGGESGSNRSNWDDVDDYHRWSGPPTDRDGNPLAGYAGWSCAVTVEFVRLDDPEAATTSDEGLKRITVVVTEPSGRATTLVGYRSRWGAFETPPDLPATVHSGVVSTIDVGAARPLYGGVALVNTPEDE